MVALSREHFASNNFKFPNPILPNTMRKVKEFLDLDRKAPDEFFYFTPKSQYYPLFVEAIEKGDCGNVCKMAAISSPNEMSEVTPVLCL
jgi:hypothetical protein